MEVKQNDRRLASLGEEFYKLFIANIVILVLGIIFLVAIIWGLAIHYAITGDVMSFVYSVIVVVVIYGMIVAIINGVLYFRVYTLDEPISEQFPIFKYGVLMIIISNIINIVLAVLFIAIAEDLIKKLFEHMYFGGGDVRSLIWGYNPVLVIIGLSGSIISMIGYILIGLAFHNAYSVGLVNDKVRNAGLMLIGAGISSFLGSTLGVDLFSFIALVLMILAYYFISELRTTATTVVVEIK